MFCGPDGFDFPSELFEVGFEVGPVCFCLSGVDVSSFGSFLGGPDSVRHVQHGLLEVVEATVGDEGKWGQWGNEHG